MGITLHTRKLQEWEWAHVEERIWFYEIPPNQIFPMLLWLSINAVKIKDHVLAADP